MKAKTVIVFDYEKEDRTYRFEIPHGAPLGEAYEAASNFLAEIVTMINDHAEKSKPKDPDEEKDPDKPDKPDEPKAIKCDDTSKESKSKKE